MFINENEDASRVCVYMEVCILSFSSSWGGGVGCAKSVLINYLVMFN